MKKKNTKNDDIFIKNVLDFYNEKGRHNLVWRKDITPYRILVSEIMLQQTQVKRVLEKFDLWMTLYPTLEFQKEATLEAILKLWEGLGYQRRAKALYEIGRKYKEIPQSFEDLLDMPGVGVYTASAISAFAYNIFGHPMLETNIRTALIEEYHQGEEIVHDGLLYDDLDRLTLNNEVQKVGARVWYYALMDYGATLKENKISHNAKSFSYKKQSSYTGSLRQLRAKTLFAILHKEKLPQDDRLSLVLEELLKEDFIVKEKNKYRIQEK